MTTIQWLEYCTSKPVIIEEEFIPTNKPHKGCMYTTVIFDGIAYDYMDTDSFEVNFGKAKFIALYVILACPHCGSFKCNEEPVQFLKIVPNTPANRARYGYEYTEPITEDTEE